MTCDELPILGRQAVREGRISAYRLRTTHRAVYRNVYLPKDAALTALTRARAAWLWSGGHAILTGLSAAAVYGTKWLDPARPAELNRSNRRSPPGIVVHSYELSAGELRVVDGMKLTTPARTVFDIGCAMPCGRALPILDAVVKATNVKIDDVLALADEKPGARGVHRLRSTLGLVDGGAESPPESRLRLLLIRSGLPPPETQIEFYDDFGHPFIRVDMGWRRWRVAVEYDGVQHWSDRRQRSWDIDRIAILEGLGWVVIRVSAEMMSRPRVIVDRVIAKLRAAGCVV